MNMDFDMENRLAARLAVAAGNHAAVPLDWHGLRARLHAAHTARGALARANACHAKIACGSFDPHSALALSVLGSASADGLGPVNRTGLGNGNSGYDNDAAVAGAPSAGERG